MAREKRDKSPSLLDADFPMRRHGIIITSGNIQQRTNPQPRSTDTDDDIVIISEKKSDNKRSRSKSSSSTSTSGSENNTVEETEVNMELNPTPTTTSANVNAITRNNSWSRDSSVDVDIERLSPPSRIANDNITNVSQVENDEEVIFLGEKIAQPRTEDPRKCPNKSTLNETAMQGRQVDVENDPEENSNCRKRPVSNPNLNQPSQSYYLDKRKKGNEEGGTHQFPSWLQGEGTETCQYERRPKSRWDNPNPGTQNIHSQPLREDPNQGAQNTHPQPQREDPNHWSNYTQPTLRQNGPNPWTPITQPQPPQDGPNPWTPITQPQPPQDGPNPWTPITQPQPPQDGPNPWTPITQPQLPQDGPNQRVPNTQPQPPRDGTDQWTPITQPHPIRDVLNRGSHSTQLQLRLNPTQMLSSPYPDTTDESRRSKNTQMFEAWPPITPNGPNNTTTTEGRNGDNVTQTDHRESQVGSPWPQANQSGPINQGHENAYNRMSGHVHEGGTMQRERNPSGSTRSRSKDGERRLDRRSRSRSRSRDRRRRESRNRSRSEERRQSRSPSPLRERERRPSGSGNYYSSKERRVSGNSSYSNSSDRGWNSSKEFDKNYHMRGHGRGGRWAQQNKFKKGFRTRNENHQQYDRGWYRNNNSRRGYGNFQRNSQWDIEGTSYQNFNSLNNYAESCRNQPPNNNILINTQHQLSEPEPEASTSAQRTENTSPAIKDPTSNEQPDYVPQSRQRIAHVPSGPRIGGNAAPASGVSAEQIRENPPRASNFTAGTLNAAQSSTAAANEIRRNSNPYSGRSVEEILRLIQTCPEPDCFNRMFDSRKRAIAHLKTDHQKNFCFICFKPVSTKGVEYKQHYLEHTNDDPEEKAQCPLCLDRHNFYGLYIHMSKSHFLALENAKPKPSGNIKKSSKLFGKEETKKVFSQKAKPTSSSWINRHKETQNRRPQFSPQRSSNQNYKSNNTSSSSQSQSQLDKSRQKVVDSELSEKCDSSSPESSRNSDDVEHNLMHAPREDIRAFRIPKKKTGSGPGS